MTISPIANSSLKSNPGASLFLQANEESLCQLVTFLDFAPEKFTICFVSVNFAEDQAAIIEALQQHPDCQAMQFARFEFDDPQLQFLQEELIEKLPQIVREPDKKLVLLLTGLEASIRMVGDLGDYPPMLVDLNYVRDGFTINVPYPVVIFLPDKALSRLAEFAPDFWAWRMAVIRFESLADDVKSRVDQFRRGSVEGQFLLKETVDKEFNARARRDIIPRFLMEYESGSLAQDENYKVFRSELMADLGISLYDGEDLDVAKEMLKKSLETEAFEKSAIARPKAHCYLGIIERRQGNYEEALELLNQSIAEFEDLRDNYHFDFKESLAKALANRGDTYRLMERYPEALADSTRAIELDPEYEWAIASRGETYRLMERYPEALADSTRAIELDPEYKWAITLRGYTYQSMERYSEALTDFNRAIELDPEYDWEIAQRGYTYQLMKRYPEALADLNRAIELDPEDKWAIALRGDTYRLMARYPEALADLNRAIELDPEDDWVIAQRGETYRLMARYPEALADLNRAIELDPEYEWATTSRGETYRLMECYPEALADLTRAIELDPEYEWAITSRGYTYRLMARYPEALADLNRAIELDPEDKWAIALRGETYRLMERYPEALADFNQAIELDTSNDWLLCMRSLTYNALKQTKNAETDIERAIQLAQKTYEAKPQDYQNIFNLALYHLTAGEINQAKHLYQDALNKEPSVSRIKEAIQDLKELLIVLPSYPHAEELRSYLQAALVSRAE